jgi:hypothetical protein
MREMIKLEDLQRFSQVKRLLKTCKDEWLESKPGAKGGKFLGVNTVRQILDHAVDGITYWDFGITQQWKEEVYRQNKSNNQWELDGYVYHVRGYLYIPGVGHREQYGCKIAIGGKDNQDSAYKAAASNCLVKCSSMFGVGEDVYSKIKVEMEEEEKYEDLYKQNDVKIKQADQKQVEKIQQEVKKEIQFEEPVIKNKEEIKQNDWNTPEIQNELKKIHLNKKRLGIEQDAQFLFYIRDFSKNGEATLKDIVPSNIKEFNEYLEKIVV